MKIYIFHFNYRANGCCPTYNRIQHVKHFCPITCYVLVFPPSIIGAKIVWQPAELRQPESFAWCRGSQETSFLQDRNNWRSAHRYPNAGKHVSNFRFRFTKIRVTNSVWPNPSNKFFMNSMHCYLSLFIVKTQAGKASKNKLGLLCLVSSTCVSMLC